MFRLGIVGSDNSHAEAFARLANTAEGKGGLHVEDVQVTHIYGTDPDRTAEVAQAGQIPHIVEKREDMIGEVDGIACVWRHGSKHLEETLPFLEAGIPAFVDKPLAASVDDAKTLIAAAQRAGVGFTSFSTLRFAETTRDYIQELGEKAGTLTAGISTGPADVTSEYDGIFFYGIHEVELMNAVWGYGCECVRATIHNGNVSAACSFKNGALVTLNLLGNASYVFHLLAFGKDDWREHVVQSGTAYYDGMNVYLDAMRTGKWPLTAEQLLEPVQILAALDKSLQENREVALDEV
jgi:predicted dehydrogenase